MASLGPSLPPSQLSVRREAEPDRVGDLRPPDRRGRRDVVVQELPEGEPERLDRRDAPREAVAHPFEKPCSRRRAQLQGADRSPDDGVAPVRRPGDVALLRDLPRDRPDVLAVEAGAARDLGERVVERVNADSPVADADDQLLAARPLDDLGVTDGAAVDEEGNVGVGVVGEVHPDRQPVPRVAVAALGIGRPRREAEALGELLRVGAENVGVQGEQRQEERVRQPGAVRVAHPDAREDLLARLFRDVSHLILGGVRHRHVDLGGRRRRRRGHRCARARPCEERRGERGPEKPPGIAVSSVHRDHPLAEFVGLETERSSPSVLGSYRRPLKPIMF